MDNLKFRKTAIFVGVCDLIILLMVFILATLAITLPMWYQLPPVNANKTLDNDAPGNVMKSLHDPNRMCVVAWIAIGGLGLSTIIGVLAAIVLIQSGSRSRARVPDEAARMASLWMVANIPTIFIYIFVVGGCLFLIFILICIPLRIVFMCLVWGYTNELKHPSRLESESEVMYRIEQNEEFRGQLREVMKKPMWNKRKEFRDLVREGGSEPMKHIGH